MRNLKLFIAIAIISLSACNKDIPAMEYVTQDTYSNRAGLWAYCTHTSNEIDTQMKLISSERVLSDDTTEKVTHHQINCPRNGVMVYTVQVVYRQ